MLGISGLVSRALSKTSVSCFNSKLLLALCCHASGSFTGKLTTAKCAANQSAFYKSEAPGRPTMKTRINRPVALQTHVNINEPYGIFLLTDLDDRSYEAFGAPVYCFLQLSGISKTRCLQSLAVQQEVCTVEKGLER